jgi:hypothetical protein
VGHAHRIGENNKRIQRGEDGGIIRKCYFANKDWIKNQICIHEEIRRLNAGNTCCLSVQNLLSYRLLSKNVKIKMYRSIILPVVVWV